MSDTFSKIPGTQQKLKWAKIWFEQFVRFHQQQNNAKSWGFSSDDVIVFLRNASPPVES